MSNIDKQWLQQKIAGMEASRDEIPFGLGEDGSNMLTALRIALASLELERGMIRRFDLDMSDCDSCGQDCGADMVEDLDGEYVLWDEVLPHLYRHDEYTAPTAPVSAPDEMTMQKALSAIERLSWQECTRDAYMLGWNACRAAMLQGAEPVTTAYKLPEGWVAVPVEPTEDMIVNGFESEPDESFSDEEVWEAYDAMSGCKQAAHRAKLCWAAMIAAAPQQEAKNV